MLELRLQPVETGVKPLDTPLAAPEAVEGKTLSYYQGLRAYHRSVQSAALSVLHQHVPDKLRLAFWAHPQFEPWRARLRSTNRKDVDVQAALSLLLDILYAGKTCRVTGWHYVLSVRLEAMLGIWHDGGLAAIARLQAAYALVGLRLDWQPHRWVGGGLSLTRSYRLSGFPPEIEALLGQPIDRMRIERPARLDNVSPRPASADPRILRDARRAARLALLERTATQAHEIEKKNPLRAERIRALNENLPEMGRQLRERAGQALLVAEQTGAGPGIAEAVRRIADAGVPLSSGRASSKSARVGGALSLGQLPSAVLRALVPHTVDIDIVSSAPSIAASFVYDQRVRRFFERCAERNQSPMEALAQRALRRIGVEAPEMALLHAATKAAKAIIIAGIHGGDERAQGGDRPLLYRKEMAGKTYPAKLAGFRQMVRKIDVVRRLFLRTWGYDGIGDRLVRSGFARCRSGMEIRIAHYPMEPVAARRRRARKALAAAYCHVEAQGVVAALRAAGESKLFRPIADKHDGAVLKRLRPGRRGEAELQRICAAAEQALRAQGVTARVRVKYDADFGEAQAAARGIVRIGALRAETVN